MALTDWAGTMYSRRLPSPRAGEHPAGLCGPPGIDTPATESAVEQASKAHDQSAIDKYRRFLVPILNAAMAQTQADPLRTRALQSDLKVAYSNACRSW